MTTITTVTPESPEPISTDPAATLAAEAVVTSAEAIAQVDVVTEKVDDAEENIEEIEQQINEVEKWQTEQTEQMQALATNQIAMQETLMQMSQAITALTELVTPQPLSELDADGIPEIAPAINAPPSEPGESVDLVQLNEQVAENLLPNPRTWI